MTQNADSAKAYKKKRKGLKGITVNGRRYEYFVGKAFVVIYAPPRSGKLAWPYLHEVAGVSADTYDRSTWKDTPDRMIEPVDVARWIANNLHKE